MSFIDFPKLLTDTFQIPNHVSSMDSISVDIHVAFPTLKNKDSISNFNVYLPAFRHFFKDLSHIEFQRVYIEGAAQPINITVWFV